MPILDVKGSSLRIFEQLELGNPAFFAELASLQILPSKDRIDVFQTSRLKAMPTATAAVGLDRFDEIVERRFFLPGGFLASRQNCSSSARPSSQNTDIKVRMKSA